MTKNAPILTAALLLVAPLVSVAAQPAEPPAINAADRRAIILDINSALEEIYVFPDTAAEMKAHLESRLAAGAYEGLDLVAFTEQLTEDLQSISHDKHLRVGYRPEPPGAEGESPTDEERRERYAAALRRANYCFERLEHLEGNVGYLRLDCFAPAEFGGTTAVAAMRFLEGSDALVIDLRNNGGGSPSMIQLLTSYLLEAEPTHLNSFYVRREDRMDQYWTQAWVPGERMPDVPVFVLTSARTFSAAEEFTYNLKNLERATIVGETTGGGAHPVDMHRVEGYPVAVSLPFGRAVNPVTGTNWEGTGVEPHVAVSADEALRVAHVRALETVAERLDDPEAAARVAFMARAIEDRAATVELSPAELAAYVGTYGPRHVTLEDGVLYYRRGDGPRHEIVPLGDDRFLVGEMNDFRIHFERGPGGEVVRLVGLYADGRQEPSERSDGN